MPQAGPLDSMHSVTSQLVRLRLQKLTGLVRSDDKRAPMDSLIPRQAGRSSTRDTTIICTLADSNVNPVARNAGALDELSAA